MQLLMLCMYQLSTYTSTVVLLIGLDGLSGPAKYMRVSLPMYGCM